MTSSPTLSPFSQSHLGGDHSPRVPKSPAFGLQRSDRSSAAISPIRLEFPSDAIEVDVATRTLREEVHKIMTGSVPPITTVSRPANFALPDIHAETLTNSWDFNASNVNRGATSPTTSIEEIHDATPLKPKLTEPEWEMIPRAKAKKPTPLPTPPASNTSLELARSDENLPHGNDDRSKAYSPSPTRSTVSLSKFRSKIPMSSFSVQKAPPAQITAAPKTPASRKPPKVVPLQPVVDAYVLADAAAESAASISIARQISVSQRQRQLLVPIRTRSVGSKGPRSGRVRAATLAAAATGNGRGTDILHVNDGGQPLTPTLVQMGPKFGQPGHMHRPSEKAVIEGI